MFGEEEKGRKRRGGKIIWFAALLKSTLKYMS